MSRTAIDIATEMQDFASKTQNSYAHVDLMVEAAMMLVTMYATLQDQGELIQIGYANAADVEVVNNELGGVVSVAIAEDAKHTMPIFILEN